MSKRLPRLGSLALTSRFACRSRVVPLYPQVRRFRKLALYCLFYYKIPILYLLSMDFLLLNVLLCTGYLVICYLRGSRCSQQKLHHHAFNAACSVVIKGLSNTPISMYIYVKCRHNMWNICFNVIFLLPSVSEIARDSLSCGNSESNAAKFCRM